MPKLNIDVRVDGLCSLLADALTHECGPPRASIVDAYNLARDIRKDIAEPSLLTDEDTAFLDKTVLDLEGAAVLTKDIMTTVIEPLFEKTVLRERQRS